MFSILMKLSYISSTVSLKNEQRHFLKRCWKLSHWTQILAISFGYQIIGEDAFPFFSITLLAQQSAPELPRTINYAKHLGTEDTSQY